MMIPTPEEQPTVSVEQAAQWLGLGRSACYEAVRRGEVPVLKFGRTLRVPTARLRVLLGLDAEPEPDSPTGTVVPMHPERARLGGRA
jgi:excisionase family DNA binding protein